MDAARREREGRPDSLQAATVLRPGGRANRFSRQPSRSAYRVRSRSDSSPASGKSSIHASNSSGWNVSDMPGIPIATDQSPRSAAISTRRESFSHTAYWLSGPSACSVVTSRSFLTSHPMRRLIGPGATERSSINASSRREHSKTEDIGTGSLRAGEATVASRLPASAGNRLGDWLNNRDVLRSIMSEGRPIRDASVDSLGNLLYQDSRRFITLERDFLRSHGWRYDPPTQLWIPPG